MLRSETTAVLGNNPIFNVFLPYIKNQPNSSNHFGYITKISYPNNIDNNIIKKRNTDIYILISATKYQFCNTENILGEIQVNEN